jgi:hypothetical protein
MDLGTGESDGLASGTGILGGLHVAMIGEGDGTGAAAAIAMTTRGGMIGTSTPAASGSAHLGGSAQLQGEGDGRGVTITTDLIGVVHVAALSGAAAGIAAATGATVNRPALSGASSGASTATAAATITPCEAGTAAGLASGSGVLGLVTHLAGASNGIADCGRPGLRLKGIGQGESDGATSTTAAITAAIAISGDSNGSRSSMFLTEITNYTSMAGHSGATADLGTSTAAGKSFPFPPAALTLSGTPNISLAGST